MTVEEKNRTVVVESRDAEIDRKVEKLVRELVATPDTDDHRISDSIYYLIKERASLLRTPRRKRA